MSDTAHLGVSVGPPVLDNHDSTPLLDLVAAIVDHILGEQVGHLFCVVRPLRLLLESELGGIGGLIDFSGRKLGETDYSCMASTSFPVYPL